MDVDVTGDTDAEANETFFVNLSNASGAIIADAQGIGTIPNDDSAAAVSNSGSSYTYNNPDADSDGMPTALENDNGLDPSDPDDAEEDPDNDGLTNSD